MSKMDVGAAVPLLVFAVFLAASAFALDDRDLNRHDLPEIQQAIGGYFEGCFSDTEANTIAASEQIRLSSNTNAKCVGICQAKGYAVATTKADYCYCSNLLPLPQLHRARDPQSAGNGGPCSVKCPGAFTSHPCEGDECCGGVEAYSVYLVGEIDVLYQMMRRLMFNFQSNDMVNKLLSGDEKSMLNCQCYNGEVTIIATAQSVSSSGEGDVKTVQITRYADGTESEIMEIDPIPDLLETKLISDHIEKLIESEEPIFETPFSSWDVMCDNTFGSTNLECSKHYEVTTGTESQYSIQTGFDIGTEVTQSVEADIIFAKSSLSTALSATASFAAGFTTTETNTISESSDFAATAEPGEKVEVRFYMSDIPVNIKWRVQFFADGSVLVRFGSVIEKKSHLSSLLTKAQRELFAFGTIDYGDRPTIIARTKTIDKDGNVVYGEIEE